MYTAWGRVKLRKVHLPSEEQIRTRAVWQKNRRRCDAWRLDTRQCCAAHSRALHPCLKESHSAWQPGGSSDSGQQFSGVSKQNGSTHSQMHVQKFTRKGNANKTTAAPSCFCTWHTKSTCHFFPYYQQSTWSNMKKPWSNCLQLFQNP